MFAAVVRAPGLRIPQPEVSAEIDHGALDHGGVLCGLRVRKRHEHEIHIDGLGVERGNLKIGQRRQVRVQARDGLSRGGVRPYLLHLHLRVVGQQPQELAAAVAGRSEHSH